MLSIKKVNKSSTNVKKYKKNNTISYNGANGVERIASIKPSFNNNEKPNNELLDQIYDHFKELKKEYKDFFKNEQSLESNIKKLFDNTNEEEFINKLCSLINIYNTSINSLYKFDKIFETDYHLTVKEIVYKFENNLSLISIFIEPDAKLRFYKSKLAKKYRENKNLFNFLCNEEKGFFHKLYLAFSSIKSVMPLDTNSKIFDKNNNGLLIDQKC